MHFVNYRLNGVQWIEIEIGWGTCVRAHRSTPLQVCMCMCVTKEPHNFHCSNIQKSKNRIASTHAAVVVFIYSGCHSQFFEQVDEWGRYTIYISTAAMKFKTQWINNYEQFSWYLAFGGLPQRIRFFFIDYCRCCCCCCYLTHDNFFFIRLCSV